MSVVHYEHCAPPVHTLSFEGAWLASRSLLEQQNQSKHLNVTELCEKNKNKSAPFNTEHPLFK